MTVTVSLPSLVTSYDILKGKRFLICPEHLPPPCQRLPQATGVKGRLIILQTKLRK